MSKGIGRVERAVLMVLAGTDQPTKAIAAAVPECHRAAASRAMGSLEAKGYIERGQSGTTITESGLRAIAKEEFRRACATVRLAQTTTLHLAGLKRRYNKESPEDVDAIWSAYERFLKDMDARRSNQK